MGRHRGCPRSSGALRTTRMLGRALPGSGFAALSCGAHLFPSLAPWLCVPTPHRRSEQCYHRPVGGPGAEAPDQMSGGVLDRRDHARRGGPALGRGGPVRPGLCRPLPSLVRRSPDHQSSSGRRRCASGCTEPPSHRAARPMPQSAVCSASAGPLSPASWALVARRRPRSARVRCPSWYALRRRQPHAAPDSERLVG